MKQPLPSGTLTLIGDALVTGDGVESIDATWQLFLRGPDDTTPAVLLHTFDHNYERDPVKRFDAVKYEESASITGGGDAGSRLTVKITPLTGGPNAFFLPNGDGATTNGRIPHFVLPQ